LKKAITEE
jgi:hypothetical protein